MHPNSTTKICTKCQEEKTISEFRYRNKSKGTLSPWCKYCIRLYERTKWSNSKKRRESNMNKAKERRKRNRKFIWYYLSERKCENCGISDPRCLEFDHLERSKKIKNVSDISSACHSIKTIKEEISKCRILCANCHRIHTYEQCNYWSPMSDSN